MAGSNVKSTSHHDVAHMQSQPSINLLHLTVSEIQPKQTFSRCLLAQPDTMGENNTGTTLKGCGGKNEKSDNERLSFEVQCFYKVYNQIY